ncbi:putative BTB/POZ domain-containing protein [Cotonvirus japonicus]|uniref:BTB/POZ domain-containing protein n=1 Tax=Cotonvirus japonicus TaxID=2811091 RepID=A0ABM7NRM8_9VIRU|nr:putative BTB/POZ domain-containing protein [Cotonvirus japonicus]BCS82746.1 putative BTB/POZ domain-containing protein [Cotonvirus japonicus]
MTDNSKLNLFVIIKDGNDINVLFVNKHDLCNLSDFFRKLCKWNTMKKTITINVSNSQISSEILLSKLGRGYCMNSFNPKSKSYNIINLYESYDYFGLHFDMKFFLEIKVQEKQFEALFNVIDKLGYNDITIRSLVQNLPNDYDLTKIPIKLLKEMYELSLNYDIICHNNKEIKNLHSKILSKTNKNYPTQSIINFDYYGLSLKNYDLMAYCVTTNKLAIYCANKKKIKIYEASSMKKLTSFFYNYSVLSMYFSAPGNYIIVCSQASDFFNRKYIYHIYNINSKNISCSFTYFLKTNNLISPNELNKIYLVPHEKYYRLYNRDINPYFYDRHTYHKLKMKEINDIKNIKYSSKGKFIVVIKSKKILVFDDSMTLKHTFCFDNEITDCCFSPNDKNILIGFHCGLIKVFTIKNKTLIKIILSQNLCAKECAISNITFSTNGKFILFVVNKKIEIWNSCNFVHLETLHIDNINFDNFNQLSLYLTTIENNLSKKIKSLYR